LSLCVCLCSSVDRVELRAIAADVPCLGNTAEGDWRGGRAAAAADATEDVSLSDPELSSGGGVREVVVVVVVVVVVAMRGHWGSQQALP